MKYSLVIYTIFTLILYSCSQAPKGDKAVITEEKATSALTGKIYSVDTASSNVRFTGHGVGKNHAGTFKFSEGTVAVQNNIITGGKIIVEMNSMVLDQKGPKYEDKLRPHLMSTDFFDAAKFNKSSFEITAVKPFERNENDTSIIKGANYMISGNLTIKDITKNISFPAYVDIANNNLTALGNFDIDRTMWKINYGNDKNLGDKFISEKVNIEMDIRTNKVIN